MKKAILYSFVVLFCIILCGCGLFEKDYAVVEDYYPDYHVSDSTGYEVTVRNITELGEAVLSVVENNSDVSDTIIFDTDYNGDPHSDMASVCKEISKNPICAYCVESLSYDIYKVPAYYETTIHVTFAESAESIDKIIRLNYSSKLSELISSSLESGNTRVAVLINYCPFNDDDIENMVYDIYYSSPLCVPREPHVVVQMFSSSGSQRLFEINIDYGVNDEEFTVFREYMKGFSDAFTEDGDSTELKIVEHACSYIINHCSISQNSSESSAYYALKQGQATSKGLSLALLSICKENGIDCMLVSGQRDWKNHYWNIVKIDDSYYHIDIERCMTDSVKEGFLLNDEDIWELYRWNLPEYPSCNSVIEYNASDILSPVQAEVAFDENTEENSD